MSKNKLKPAGEIAVERAIREGSPLRSSPPASRNLKDFEEMQVWQDAQDLAVAVYGDMRTVKDFSFIDQIKRAAVSISNNVAEGAERVTSSEFARFLDIAKGSTGEVRSMYRLAARLGFMDAGVSEVRCAACRAISRQLGGFAKHLRAASRQQRIANK